MGHGLWSLRGMISLPALCETVDCSTKAGVLRCVGVVQSLVSSAHDVEFEPRRRLAACHNSCSLQSRTRTASFFFKRSIAHGSILLASEECFKAAEVECLRKWLFTRIGICSNHLHCGIAEPSAVRSSARGAWSKQCQLRYS